MSPNPSLNLCSAALRSETASVLANIPPRIDLIRAMVFDILTFPPIIEGPLFAHPLPVRGGAIPVDRAF